VNIVTSVTTPNTQTQNDLDIDAANCDLASGNAEQIVQWAADNFKSGIALSSSFGIQAAVMLHLVSRIIPDIPVIWVDTGYLFPETYTFAHDLKQRLNLNLQVVQSPISPAHMEATQGRLWESDDVEDFNTYDRIRKVEPMQRAIKDLGITTLFAGLRRGQTEHRKNLPYILHQNGQYNVYPILDWSAKDVHNYLQKNDLPYHPLREQGYMSLGDSHSSRPVTDDDTDDRNTRFRGLKQECGLHLPQSKEEDQSLESAGL
jgi:phosphoadenosine phosphosulfate reductase